MGELKLTYPEYFFESNSDHLRVAYKKNGTENDDFRVLSANPLSFIDPDGGRDGNGQDRSEAGGGGNYDWIDHSPNRRYSGGGGGSGGGSFGSLASRTWRIANGNSSLSGSQVARYAFSYSNGTTGDVMNQINWELSYANNTTTTWHQGASWVYNGFGTTDGWSFTHDENLTLHVETTFENFVNPLDNMYDFDPAQVSNTVTSTFGLGVGYLGHLSSNKHWLNKNAQQVAKQLKNSGINVGSEKIFKTNIKSGLRSASRGLAVAGVAITAYEIASAGEIRASHLLSVGVLGLSTIPVVGWVVGGGFFVSDMITMGITGRSIGQHLDSSLDGGVLYDF
ncbi:MAG: hypothetical protein JKY48_06460 [Flavobacteriales bacterium]|nr:hypothetical protein [Flavobacteriales bacterium]